MEARESENICIIFPIMAHYTMSVCYNIIDYGVRLQRSNSVMLFCCLMNTTSIPFCIYKCHIFSCLCARENQDSEYNLILNYKIVKS